MPSDPSSCLTDSCNIRQEQTTEGIRQVFIPTGDPGRADMPAGLPQGIFRDRDGCLHVLPTGFGLCERVSHEGFSFTATDGQAVPGPIPGTVLAEAQVTNDTPYPICITITRWVGCAEFTTVPGAQWSYGLGPSNAGSAETCLAEVPGMNSYSWPNAGVFLAEPGDYQARATFAFLALFNRVPDSNGWVDWLTAQVAAAGGDPAAGPDDLTLWRTICESAASTNDPGLTRPVKVNGVTETFCTILQPGATSVNYTARPYFEGVRYGAEYPTCYQAKIESTASYGVCITGVPLAPASGFTYPT